VPPRMCCGALREVAVVVVVVVVGVVVLLLWRIVPCVFSWVVVQTPMRGPCRREREVPRKVGVVWMGV